MLRIRRGYGCGFRIQIVGDEADWIARAQRADTRAFERLYRMHVDKVYGLCLRMTGNVAEAEDCVQEAFIQAWNKIDRFRGESAFATWLHRIAVNSVLGRMRKSKRERDRIELAGEIVDSPTTTADTGELRDGETQWRDVFVLLRQFGNRWRVGDRCVAREGLANR